MRHSIDQTLRRARLHEKKGEIEQAQKLYQTALNAFPKNKRAKQALAKIRESELIITDSTTQPSAEKVKALATLLTKGKYRQVAERAEELLIEFPSSAPLWDILGGAYKSQKKFVAAEKALRRAVELSPKSHQIQNNLGTVLKAVRKTDEAIIAFQSAIEIKQTYAQAHHNLGKTLLEKGDVADAIDSYKKAIKYNSKNFDVYYELGDILIAEERLDEAIFHYQKGLDLNPQNANAYLNIANSFKTKGEIGKAINAYKMALEIDPNFAGCYAELTSLKGFPIDNDLKNKVEKLLLNENLSQTDERHLKYALFNICDRLNKRQEAFNWLVDAGEVRRKELNYSIKEDYALFTSIYNKAPEYLRNYVFSQEALKTPIFIVGMPRSGTTLLEQIISSHTSVYGAGELTTFPKLALPLVRKKEFSHNHVNILRSKYLDHIYSISSDHLYVTDKLPHNFRFLPMICAALPEAKIVHIHRDPRATCWSNFSSNFKSTKLGYSFSLETVIEYYYLYSRLMTEWSNVLGNRIYHLSYETLIDDQEIQTRKLLKYLGLDWEEEVLSPHKNSKIVRTASAEQVRQPIYKNSSEKWMRYEPFLSTPFKSLEAFRKPE